MSVKSIYIGDELANFESKEVIGTLVEVDGERFYKIENSDTMRPFFMSIVSDSNHWMFIASNGGLTAGRKDCDHALFPYYTDDKIIESADLTGSKTLVQVHVEDKTYLWEPFSTKFDGVYKIQQNLYKNSFGNKIIFEEINHDLAISVKIAWSSSNLYGFVKQTTVCNLGSTNKKLTLLDGLQNIMPFGLKAEFQNGKSNLVDAYKKSELEASVGMGIYALSAIIVDKAEPSEALKGNIVWSIGANVDTYLISSLQLDAFRKGQKVLQEVDVRAEKGAYFVKLNLNLAAGENTDWLTVADVNQSIVSIEEIADQLKNNPNLKKDILENVALGTQNLIDLTTSSDGVQISEDALQNTRHFANTLFNIMRGGVFDDNYKIERFDFIKYIASANRLVYKEQAHFLKNLSESFTLEALKRDVQDAACQDFKRLCFEYMPLKFSRRHGDPSRPWNRFSIKTVSEIDGSKILDYEGNWRDIFQNWETLAYAYPAFTEQMIHKFLNASTFEGYNPYRVTKSGFDWEVVEPEDPWSFIGYWGDHQIIYLLKFLECLEKHYPGDLAGYFNKNVFVFANVPYKIKSYTDIVKDPKDTIVYDVVLHDQIIQKKQDLGADGALLCDVNNRIYKVSFIEKMLVTLLAKISNFIPEAGIWLNTQRPEWNDANNALVGNGVSMVTLYYLRRFLTFFEGIVARDDAEEFSISEVLHTMFKEINNVLETHKELLSGSFTDTQRNTMVEGLGIAGSTYRNIVYAKGFSGLKKEVSRLNLLEFLQTTRLFIEHSIVANKRADGLYHAYNLMSVADNNKEMSVDHLSEMLEGQVAVLSAGFLSAQESLAVLDSLKTSLLFRVDQASYILYPNKELSRFRQKNEIAPKGVEKSKLLQQLLKKGNTQIIEKDVLGTCHFNGDFNNAKSLESALSNLDKSYDYLVNEERVLVLEIFEETFNHKSFTGRSGTFYGYEGLGSIYWHMVSKLLLAVQEVCVNAVTAQEDTQVICKLKNHYREIYEGIGVHKSPSLYGAFPTDPYSHTPAGKGAQQPGMTGQVKEDVLTRFGELGVVVHNGILSFRPVLLARNEFLKKEKLFKYKDVASVEHIIKLDKGSLCFTYCQVPVVYNLASETNMIVDFIDGTVLSFKDVVLDKKTSNKIFGRTGDVAKITVFVSRTNVDLK